MRLETFVRHVLDAVTAVFTQFGVQNIERASIEKKEELVLEHDVTTIVGLTGDANGNVAIACSEETAKKLASVVMMGMPVTEMNELARAAVTEFCHIIAQNATLRMANDKATVAPSQPSVIVGQKVMVILSFMSTYSVTLRTPYGYVEVSFAVEL